MVSHPQTVRDVLFAALVEHQGRGRKYGDALVTGLLDDLDAAGYVVIPKSERDEMLAAYVMNELR